MDGWVVSSVKLRPDVRVSASRNIPKNVPAPVKTHVRLISAYLHGRPVSLRTIPIDLNAVTPFARSVLIAARSIPRGTTLSYAELARKAGRPAAVRAAASVMRNNPFPLLVPCHRVIRSDGTIGGFMGATRGGSIVVKRLLLQREGRRLPGDG